MRKKFIMVFLVICLWMTLTPITAADQVIGERCYAIEPAGAPQDNGVEKLFVVERGELGSGIFDSVGYHEDLAGVRTPMHATSTRIIDSVTGGVTFSRIAYGALGDVHSEIHSADNDDVQLMFDMMPRTALFVSHSVLLDDQNGNVRGTFRADVWHHDFSAVAMVPGMNSGPGLIFSIPCD